MYGEDYEEREAAGLSGVDSFLPACFCSVASNVSFCLLALFSPGVVDAAKAFKEAVYGEDYEEREAAREAELREKAEAALQKRKALEGAAQARAGDIDWKGLASQGQVQHCSVQYCSVLCCSAHFDGLSCATVLFVWWWCSSHVFPSQGVGVQRFLHLCS